ncbi:acidic mammalian chitinase-like [Ornithodoros turicata]|uniref:acidic mammalian chitinase-like n=1 Tax=Ornithodoros turicata TaxID=34597 RepID=UPI003138DFDA
MKAAVVAYLVCVCTFAARRVYSVTNNDSGPHSLSRVCYYAPGSPSPSPTDLDPMLCTHIIFGFADVGKNNTLIPTHPDDVSKYVKLTGLKNINPDLKVMLSVGGGGYGSPFSRMANSSESRHTFLSSAAHLLRNYNFDGLDIDWEFPAKSERENLVLLLKEARKVLNHLLLSVAVASTETIIDTAYDVPGLAMYVNFINLMSYDYHVYQPYLPFTGHNSPLFHRKVEQGYFSTLNTAWSAEYWASSGMPRNKIMVGIPTYARTFTLLDPADHGFDAPVSGIGPGGGSVGYPWVCDFLRNKSTSVFDDESQVPYAYKDTTWVAYDTFASIRSKVIWVKARQFAGVMTFDLCNDDTTGSCNQGKFPLHNMIAKMLT